MKLVVIIALIQFSGNRVAICCIWLIYTKNIILL